METELISAEKRWSESRSGGWAARGFHYQHLVTTLVLAKQWAGEISPGKLVPEGLEDCNIEMTAQSVFLQVKSKFEGEFSDSKVNSVMQEVIEKASIISGDLPQRRVICLEKPVKGQTYKSFEDFTEDEDKVVYICADPVTSIVETLIAHCECVDHVAYILADQLYAHIAGAAANNAGKSYGDRIGFTPADTGKLIQDLLNATEGSYLADALQSGLVKHLDLKTALPEPGFYLGVKAKPGHIAAGLILERPKSLDEVKEGFKTGRPVLIEGQSGAGKSALMWLLASSTQTEMRWFEVSSQATLADAATIVTCLQARRPSVRSPVAVAMDDVGPTNADLWTHICDAVGHLPHIHIVGTIRIEDKVLVRDAAEIIFHRVALDELFAEEVWNQLKSQKLTDWQHWKEPFEQSNGLLLEYVHILTQGKRLAAVIADQVAVRVAEKRNDELSILRATSVLSALGAEIDAQRLFQKLGLDLSKASFALKRLTDEHLVRENRPGILGGLHSLRSVALVNATHDDIVFQQTQSILKAMSAVTSGSLPEFMLQCFRHKGFEESELLQHFADTISGTGELETWVAILTGLGLVSLDKYATIFISCLDTHKVQPAQRLSVAMFTIAGTDTSFFDKLDHMDGFRTALEELSDHVVQDLRQECLELITGQKKSPDCLSFSDAIDFLRSITPLPNGPMIDIDFSIGIEGEGFPDIEETASLMSTAYAVSPKIAADIATALGGEDRLISEFSRQTPWVSEPTVSEDEEGQKTLSCSHFRVSDDHQGDAHAAVVKHCETLVAICPSIDRIDFDATRPNGEVLSIGGYTIASKRISRDALPPESSIAWNVSFGHILRSRISSPTQTEYASNMAALAQRTEKAFRRFTEKWIRNKNDTLTDDQLTEMNAIISETNDQIYEAPEPPKPHYELDKGGSFISDTKGALYVGLLSNLNGRLVKSTLEGADKAIAMYAADLAKQARNSLQSKLWDSLPERPTQVLEDIETRVTNISDIMYELSTPESDVTIGGLNGIAKKASMNKRVAKAAYYCRQAVDARFRSTLSKIEEDLRDLGIEAKCATRPGEKHNSPYWPNREVAIVIDLTSIESDGAHIEQALEVGHHHLQNNWKYCVVPTVGGNVIARAVMERSMGMGLPVTEFTDNWKEHISPSFPSDTLAIAFADAGSACLSLSAILCCSSLDAPHPVEVDLQNKLIDQFLKRKEQLILVAEATDNEILQEACDHLGDMWNRWIDERDAGEPITSPLCEDPYRALNGEVIEENNLLGVLLILLSEAELSLDLSAFDLRA